ncbi:MAG: pro-sigmaK processing inhibitor BofA family protein [Ruminococcus sp.]|nr:pro-sigmaK processing inhibitor BofA family protein [Ruminococcus sp.]
MEISIILFATLIIFSVIHYLGKNKRPIKRALLSMICGGGILAAINITTAFTGVYLPVSLLSILISIVGGVPGVTLMLGLNLFF